MMHAVLPAAFLSLAALPAFGESFSRISDKSAFLQTVEGKELRLGLFGIALKVEEDGEIKGRALGWDVTGTWEWQDGYFCREMDWSGYPIPKNCQLVEAKGGEEIRFTVDKGAGDSASFKLR
ncbi:MAG: dihydrodipicolinate reductase [Paracoccaceae bacterium]